MQIDRRTEICKPHYDYYIPEFNPIQIDPHCNPVQGLYRASTGPEQGFPCEVFHTGKNLFSLQGTLVLIAGTPVFITGNGFAVNLREN